MMCLEMKLREKFMIEKGNKVFVKNKRCKVKEGVEDLLWISIKYLRTLVSVDREEVVDMEKGHFFPFPQEVEDSNISHSLEINNKILGLNFIVIRKRRSPYSLMLNILNK